MNQLTSSWKNLPPMTTTRFGFAAATLGGKLFAVGGCGDGMDSIEFFDFNKRRWTQAPARMIHGRHSCAAAAIGNSIYVAGGDDGGSRLDSVEAFDVDSGLWRMLPSMSTKRGGCAAVAVGDELIVIGGLGDPFTLPLNTAESFNVRTGQWKDLPPMINRRWGCAAAVIKNKIYVVGGQDGRSMLDTVDVFDLKTRTWTLLPQRMVTRGEGCATAAVGNYLVVARGDNDETSIPCTFEMYDVDTERWMELPPMSKERLGSAVVSLGGSVYVMGGQDGSDDELDSVEEIQFNDDIVKGMLVEWTEGSWRNEVAPILHNRTSVIHKLDVDSALMPTLLSCIGKEERVQTIFKMVRGEMSAFKHACWRPNKKLRRC